ncbi:MAG: hypothetical protein NVS3B21_15960 [Acidimicrobiales bacterium]
MAEVVVFAPDLMDRSKITGAAPGASVVRSVDAVSAGPGVIVVVDLSRPGVVDALGGWVAAGARVIGFASHVDRDLIDAGRGAGAEVMARSAFFGRVAELLS